MDLSFRRAIAASLIAALGATAFPAVAGPAFEQPVPHKFEEDKLPQAKLTNGLLFQLIATEIALQRNELGAAYKTYMSMAEQTGDPRLAERATRVAQTAKAPKEILAAAKLWNRLAPGNKDAQELLIHSALFYGELEKILPMTKDFLSQLKDPSQELVQIQVMLAQGKDKAKGLEFFKEISEPYPKSYATPLGLARLELLLGELAPALKNAKLAYSRMQNTDTVSVLAAVLLKQSPKQAIALLQEYLGKHPEDLKIRDSYARLALTTGADAQLNNLAKTYADDGKFAVALALEYLRLRKIPKATEVLKSFLAVSGKDTSQQEEIDRAKLVLSQLALEKKKFAEALFYTSEIKEGPLRPLADIQTANIFHKEGDDQKALFYLNAAKAQNPEQLTDIILQKAKLYSEISGDEASLKYMQTELKRNPNLRDIQYETGLRAEALGLFEDAEKHLREAVRIDPKFSNAYNTLGYSILERKGATREARKNIEKAFELEPDNPYILDSLGWLRFKEGKRKEAIKILRQALKVQEEEEIMLHLAEVLYKNGNKAEAQEVLKKIEDTWPESDKAWKLKKKLAR